MRVLLALSLAFLLLLPFAPSAAAGVGSCVGSGTTFVCHGGGCVRVERGVSDSEACVPLAPVCTDDIMESVYVCANDPAGCFGYSVAGYYRALACV